MAIEYLILWIESSVIVYIRTIPTILPDTCHNTNYFQVPIIRVFSITNKMFLIF